MLIAYVPLLIAVIGLLLWVLATNGTVKEIGKIMFVIGFFWFVYALTGKTVHLLT